MPAIQIYRAVLIAPPILAAPLVAALLTLFTFPCDGGCTWQDDLAQTLSKGLHAFFDTFSFFSYRAAAVYCAIGAVAGHFAFPGRFLKRTLSATWTGLVLGISVFSIAAAQIGLTNWTSCLIGESYPSCMDGMTTALLNYAATIVFMTTTVFFPIGLAVSLAHAILLGIIYAAYSERSRT